MGGSGWHRAGKLLAVALLAHSVEALAESSPSCAALQPGELGPGQSLVVDAHARYPECGPGISNGEGYLALLNSGTYGARAWDVVSPEGSLTGKTLGGGDMAMDLQGQPSGFHVLKVTPDNGITMNVYTSEGEYVRSVRLVETDDPPSRVVNARQGETLVAQWVRRGDGTQGLRIQFIDPMGLPRTQPLEVVSAPQSEHRAVLAGVDSNGRVLLLWPESGSSTWVGQWRDSNGGILTASFSFPAPTSSTGGQLHALAGGGLALQTNGQWVARFPGGEPLAQPAPAWLASHPNTQLVLIRGRQAHVLVPPPTFNAASGCQESLLLFTQDGTACGEVLLPPEGTTCFQRELGIGPDGTVIQQLDVSATEEHACGWRWWPGLL